MKRARAVPARDFHAYTWQDGPPPAWQRHHDAYLDWLIQAH